MKLYSCILLAVQTVAISHMLSNPETNPPQEQSSAEATSLATECDSGKAESCTKLGLLYSGGKGVAKDLKRAADFYQKGCDAGDAAGCGLLGFAYATGAGAPLDAKRAVGFFQRACDAGDAAGCGLLGWQYATGEGVSKDEKRAAELFSRACDAGNALACEGLGRLYAVGAGVPRDESRAAQLLAHACDAGLASACAELKLYSRGQEVPQARKPDATQKPLIPQGHSAEWMDAFGFRQGMTKAQVVAIVGSKSITDEGPDTLMLRTAPKPLPIFWSYVVAISRSTGLAQVVAASYPLSTADQQDQLKAGFDEIRAALESKFGPAQVDDSANSGHREERVLTARWLHLDGVKIGLTAQGDSKLGTMILQYEFPNFADWKREHKEKQPARH